MKNNTMIPYNPKKDLETNYYNKTEIELLIAGGSGGSIDLSNYYKKLETYSKAQVDALVAGGGADLSDYYTKAEVDGLLDSISLDDYYTKTQTEVLLSNKVEKEDGKGLSTNDFTNTFKQAYDGHLASISNPHNTTANQVGAYSKIEVDNLLANIDISGASLTNYYDKTQTETLLLNKVDKGTEVVGATKTKVTYNNDGIITGGADLAEADLPDISQTKITNLVSDLSNKQSSLISGTNIKTINGQSVLGNGNIFITAEIASPLHQPIIISPANGTVDYIGSITSTYSTSESFVGVQDWVRWEASTDENFTTLIDSYEGSDNLINWTPAIGGLYITTTVYVRTKQGSDNYLSVWSEVISFTTPNIFVETPIITLEGTPSDVKKNLKITLSAFSVFNGTDTHELSDYQVIKVSNGTVVWESLDNTTDLLSITTGDLEVSTQYKFRARQKGQVYGYSSWVETTITTAAMFTPTIGIQGKKGFSVAPTTEPFALLGLAEMTGTNVIGSDNYGNYIHTNGSIVCWCPKAYYRVGSSESPRFATYGANALDIVGAETFSTTAEANTAGYALHRAFINAGAEQSGFFIDKYMNSKDGTTASKSVFGGVPISLATTAGYTVSSGMTGCTGRLADAVVLSKARGTRWNTATAFMYGYLAMVSVAQAQAATSTADVAWYDPTGVKNYPKGCNNNALSDVDDTTVKYASAGDSGDTNKPKTGATANFAKTTHNGSNNGVADLNGGMYEVTIGITNFGSSATASTAITNNTIYVLKHSTDIATLTAGWNGATDVWGNAANLANKYDSVTSPHPLGSSAETVYWGNGTNAVLQNDLSGVNRDVCGFIPKNSSSTGATGANLFGNDYLYKNNVQNMVPLACGYWSHSTTTGVFYRYFYAGRSDSYGYYGFRASAYFS